MARQLPPPWADADPPNPPRELLAVPELLLNPEREPPLADDPPIDAMPSAREPGRGRASAALGSPPEVGVSCHV